MHLSVSLRVADYDKSPAYLINPLGCMQYWFYHLKTKPCIFLTILIAWYVFLKNYVFFIPSNLAPTLSNHKESKTKPLVFPQIKARFGYLHNCFDTEEENTFFFFSCRAWDSKITDKTFLLMKSEIIVVLLVFL